MDKRQLAWFVCQSVLMLLSNLAYCGVQSWFMYPLTVVFAFLSTKVLLNGSSQLL